MAETVFYAWQSDLPGNETHYILGRALKTACKTLADEPSLVAVEPDRDTQNVPGAPDISATIFEKIRGAVAVVADMSIVTPTLDGDTRGPGRLSPNPNVLVEVGYAKGVLNPSAVVLVMNTDYGAPEDLPFDLRPRRVVRFSTRNAAGKKQVERDLAAQLVTQLRAILATRQTDDDEDVDELVRSVETQAPDRKAKARRFADAVIDGFDQHAPRFSAQPMWAKREVGPDGDDRFRANEVWNTVIGFSPGFTSVARVARAVALAGDTTVAGELLRLLERVVTRYQPPRGWGGPVGRLVQAELDVYCALGYEIALILTSSYLQEEAWPLLRDLASAKLRPDNVEAASVGIGYAAQEVEILGVLQDRQTRHASRASRGWVTRELHDESGLTPLVTRAQAVEADVLLTLNDTERPSVEWESQWFPFAIEILQRGDLQFLRRAREEAYASRLASALDIEGVEALRERLASLVERVRRMDVPGRGPLRAFSGFDVSSIGTE